MSDKLKPKKRKPLKHPDFDHSWKFLNETLGLQKEATINKLLAILDGIDKDDICFCHNDIWGDNIIRNENELFVIDFGDADWGFRGWDLAYFFLHNQSFGKF